MTKANFYDYIPTPEESLVSGPDARSHTETVLATRPGTKDLIERWEAMSHEPFHGVTTDGKIIPGLFDLRPEDAPVLGMIEATISLLDRLSDEQRKTCVFAIEDDKWRAWQNTELWVENYGLRLEEVSEDIRDACLAVIKASLSAEGYDRTRKTMKLNGFLGELVDAPKVMGEFSYTFPLFGAPSRDEPWGWQLFGHHLSLNCVVIGSQMTITPTFMGAEPAWADKGQFAGITLFEDEERLGLELRRSLSESQASQAQIFDDMVEGLPEGRRQYGDGLHLGGAHQDNRIIPYEGIKCSELDASQRKRLLDLSAEYIGTLPEGPFGARMEDLERHLDETRFAWVGGTEEGTAFYYRIQSPVVMIEFDHHAGVYLTNELPLNFHVHTLVRTPNGNDYGADLLRQHYENAPHHQHGHSHD